MTRLAPIDAPHDVPAAAARRSSSCCGGFNGTDPTPTLAQFQADVAAGKIHYFLAGGGFGGSSSSASAIAGWVERHFDSTTVGGVAVYDLTARTPSTQDLDGS
jgi:hypothetical protein